jgi:hypothetical protein
MSTVRPSRVVAPVIAALLLSLWFMPLVAEAVPQGYVNAHIDVSGTGDGYLVTFACEGVAAGPAVAAKIAAESGCTVVRGGDVVASAPGRTLTGPAVATADSQEVAGGLGPLQVCAEVEFLYVDNSSATIRVCVDARA